MSEEQPTELGANKPKQSSGKGKKRSRPKSDSGTKGKASTVTDSNPEQDRNRMAELEKSIRQRVALEEKAFRVVERLLDNPIREDFFIDAGMFIDPSHYADVVEERSISDLCGYPICTKVLTSVPNKKYHISTKTNRVYDITERKKFCSNECFKASKFYEKQLSSTPVWLRGEEPSVTIQLLHPTDNRGSTGEAVVIDHTLATKQSLADIQRLDQAAYRDVEGRQEQGGHGGPSEDKVEDSHHAARYVLKDGILVQETPVQGEEARKQQMETCDCVPYSDTIEGQGHLEGQAEGHSLAQLPEPSINTDTTSGCRLDARVSDIRDNKRPSNKRVQFIEDHAPSQVSGGRLEQSKENVSGRTSGISSKSVKENIQRLYQQNQTGTHSAGKHEPGTSHSPPVNLGAVPRAQFKVEDRGQRSPMELIRSIVMEWKTLDSVQFLKKRAGGSVGAKQGDRIGESGVDFAVKYRRLCRKVDRQQKDLSGLMDVDDDDEDAGSSLDLEASTNSVQEAKGLSAMNALERDMTELQVVEREVSLTNKQERARRGKDNKIPKDPASLEVENEDMQSADWEVLLPTIDSHDQVTIRRKIVLGKLTSAMPDLLGPLHMTMREIADEVRGLVHTFNLTSSNIVLKPVGWTLVSYFLLHLLSLRNEALQAAVQGLSSTHYVRSFIGGLGVTDSQVQQLMQDFVGESETESQTRVPGSY